MGPLLDLSTAAEYNAWANIRIYNALKNLSDDQRKEDRRAFFRSIHNTMNHILLADLIYRERLEKKPTTYKTLNEVLHTDFDELEAAHRADDLWYVDHYSSFDADELEGDMSFKAVGMDEDEYFALPMRLCLTNLFQHQIHHRGQVHHMISHAGNNPPPVDVVKFGRGDKDDWSDAA